MSSKRVPPLRFSEFKDSTLKIVSSDILFESITNKEHNSDLPILAITQEYGAIPRDQIDYNVSVSDKSLESYKVVEVGDFIISLRSFQGGIEYSNYRGICSPAYIILRKKIDLVNDYYKFYFKTQRYINVLNKDLEGLRDGKMVSYGQFSSIKIPNPDIPEQQKIADCLTSLDELLSAENTKLELLKQHKKALMQKLFPQEGKTVPEWRFLEFRGDKDWEEKRLEEVGKITSGTTPFRGKKDFFENGHINWVKTTDLNNSNIVDSEEKITALALAETSLKLLPKKTILIAMYGGFNQIGRTGLTNIEVTINQALSALVLDKKYLPEYILSYLNGYRNLWKKVAISSRKDANITKKDVENFKIIIPSLQEQEKIAKCLSSIDERITAQAEKVELLKEHKKALLQGLFVDGEE